MIEWWSGDWSRGLTHLVDEVLEGRRAGVEPLQVGVQGEVGERLPRWLVGLHLDGVHAERRLVPHGRAGHHGDALHRAVAQLPAVLQHPALRTLDTVPSTNPIQPTRADHSIVVPTCLSATH